MTQRGKMPRHAPPDDMPIEGGMGEKLNVTNKKSNAPSRKSRGSPTTSRRKDTTSTCFLALCALALLPIVCSPTILMFYGFGAVFRALTMPIRIAWEIVTWLPEIIMTLIVDYKASVISRHQPYK